MVRLRKERIRLRSQNNSVCKAIARRKFFLAICSKDVKTNDFVCSVELRKLCIFLSGTKKSAFIGATNRFLFSPQIDVLIPLFSRLNAFEKRHFIAVLTASERQLLLNRTTLDERRRAPPPIKASFLAPLCHSTFIRLVCGSVWFVPRSIRAPL